MTALIRCTCLILLLLTGRALRAETMDVRLAPGESLTFPLTMTNDSDANVELTVLLRDPDGFYNWPYAFEVQPPCNIHEPRMWWGPTVAPHQSVVCTVTITRSSAIWAIKSTTIVFAGFPSSLRTSPSALDLGDFSTMEFSVEPVQPLPVPGETQQLYRVTARSHSISNLTGSAIENSYFPNPPYTFDNEFPGGCRDTNAQNGIDFPGSSSQAFELPVIPPLGESSCLIRLNAAGGIVPGTSMEFFGYPGTTDDMYRLEIPDGTLLVGGATAAHLGVPVLSVAAFIALIVLVLTGAVLQVRRHPPLDVR